MTHYKVIWTCFDAFLAMATCPALTVRFLKKCRSGPFLDFLLDIFSESKMAFLTIFLALFSMSKQVESNVSLPGSISSRTQLLHHNATKLLSNSTLLMSTQEIALNFSPIVTSSFSPAKGIFPPSKYRTTGIGEMCTYSNRC